MQARVGTVRGAAVLRRGQDSRHYAVCQEAPDVDGVIGRQKEGVIIYIIQA